MMEEAAFAVILLVLSLATVARVATRELVGDEAPSDVIRLAAWLLVGLWLVALGGAAGAGTWGVGLPLSVRLSGAALAVVLLVAFGRGRRRWPTSAALIAALGTAAAFAADSTYVLLLGMLAALCLLTFDRLSA